jgi:hypothetical protein
MIYLGPDSVVPFASVLAAIGGAILLFWRQVKGVVARIRGTFSRK